jgi:hypothetical protein
VHPEHNRNYLLAQTGAELYGYQRLQSLGALDYRVYGGTIFLDTTPPTPGSPLQLQSFNVPYLAGGRLLWETPLDGLRFGGSVQVLRLDATILAGTQTATVQVPATLWVGSMEYSANRLLLAAEYSRWYLKSDSSNPMIFPQTPEMVSERAYGMAAYRAAKWLQPGVYYSILFPDVDHRVGRANIQHDVATTLRFDINDHWLFKLEGHFMSGTAGLMSNLNGNLPLTALERNWEVLLLKTTAYF